MAAAVVIATSVGLISVPELDAVRRVRRAEFSWAVAAMAGVILVGTLLGIPGAVVLSMGSLMYQANEAPVYVIGRKRGADVQRAAVGGTCRRRDVSGPFDPAHRGPLSFANAQRIADRMAPLGARLGRERMFFNVNRAVETCLARQSSSNPQPGR